MPESQDALKKEIQCLWEDVIYQAKIWLKSFDMSFRLEIWFLSVASIIELLCICFSINSNILDFISVTLTVISLIFTIYFWLNQWIYKDYWEKYMSIYHELEHYYKSNVWKYKESEIKKFCTNINRLNWEKKPWLFPFIKSIVENTVKEETRHSWEKYPWRYFEN